ncbi:MAG: response regulator [Spirochaetota bacterium]
MKRALVVDDSPVGRMIVSRIVTGAGWEAIEAHDGSDALARLDEVAPEIVFLDLLMPGLTGLDVLRELRTIRRDLPVVILTADLQSSTREACEKLGVYAYITKPASASTIHRLLTSVPAGAV